jgi:hypothetical protein
LIIKSLQFKPDLDRFGHFAGSQATGTNISLLGRFTILNSQLFDVRHPAGFGQIMGVADLVASLRPFATNITSFRHGDKLPISNYFNTLYYLNTQEAQSKPIKIQIFLLLIK